MAKKKDEVSVVSITPIKIRTTSVRIVGDTPLIVHAWSDKAKKEMIEAQTGKAKGKKKPIRRPADDFVQAAYWLTRKPEYGEDASNEEILSICEEAIAAGARFGFPATALKQATTAGAYRLGWVKNQAAARGAFFFKADENGLVEIHSDPPIMREDNVKIGQGKADLRYRPQFNNWWIDLTVEYNEQSGFSLENIINMLNAGGFVCGIGEWRPEKDGNNGMYHVQAG